MYPIVRKETLADNIILMDIKAPRVAAECLPGQFIIAKTDEVGERIPLTICDYDREKETVTIVVQTIGAGTERMMRQRRKISYLSQVDLVPLQYIHRLSGFMSMALMQMSSWDQEPRICCSISMR